MKEQDIPYYNLVDCVNEKGDDITRSIKFGIKILNIIEELK